MMSKIGPSKETNAIRPYYHGLIVCVPLANKTQLPLPDPIPSFYETFYDPGTDG